MGAETMVVVRWSDITVSHVGHSRMFPRPRQKALSLAATVKPVLNGHARATS